MKKTSDIILQTTLTVLLLLIGLALLLIIFGTMYGDEEWTKGVVLFILKILLLVTNVAIPLYVFFGFIEDRSKISWFESLPLHWRYIYHTIGGIVIGYLLHYLF